MNNPDIVYTDTYDFEGESLVKGTKIKFKGRRGEFAFQKLAENTKLGVRWIDCVDLLTHQWNSFYVEELTKIVKPRKRRTKK